jgi:hypothetical protein
MSWQIDAVALWVDLVHLGIFFLHVWWNSAGSGFAWVGIPRTLSLWTPLSGFCLIRKLCYLSLSSSSLLGLLAGYGCCVCLSAVGKNLFAVAGKRWSHRIGGQCLEASIPSIGDR